MIGMRRLRPGEDDRLAQIGGFYGKIDECTDHVKSQFVRYFEQGLSRHIGIGGPDRIAGVYQSARDAVHERIDGYPVRLLVLECRHYAFYAVH